MIGVGVLGVGAAAYWGWNRKTLADTWIEAPGTSGWVNLDAVKEAFQNDSSIEDLQESLDDFWADGKHPCSNIVGWFQFDPPAEAVEFELFSRKNFEKHP